MYGGHEVSYVIKLPLEKHMLNCTNITTLVQKRDGHLKTFALDIGEPLPVHDVPLGQRRSY